MQVSVQNRSVVYAGESDPALIPEGLHPAELVAVTPLEGAFGARLGLVFRLMDGPYSGRELMQSAAVTGSPAGKLAELLRGLGGADGSPDTARALIGRRCWIAVRHDHNRGGHPFARIVQTSR